MLNDKQMALRILATGVVLAMGASGLVLSGCATVFPPDEITLAAGERHCTGTKAQCDAMYATAATLHTPEMERAIAEARR